MTSRIPAAPELRVISVLGRFARQSAGGRDAFLPNVARLPGGKRPRPLTASGRSRILAAPASRAPDGSLADIGSSCWLWCGRQIADGLVSLATRPAAGRRCPPHGGRHLPSFSSERRVALKKLPPEVRSSFVAGPPGAKGFGAFSHFRPRPGLVRRSRTAERDDLGGRRTVIGSASPNSRRTNPAGAAAAAPRLPDARELRVAPRLAPAAKGVRAHFRINALLPDGVAAARESKRQDGTIGRTVPVDR